MAASMIVQCLVGPNIATRDLLLVLWYLMLSNVGTLMPEQTAQTFL